MLKQLKRKFILITTSIVFVLLTIILTLICAFVSRDQQMENRDALQKISRAAAGPANMRNLPRDVALPYFVVYMSPDGEYVVGGYSGHDLSDEEYINELVDAATESGEEYGVLRREQLHYSVKRMPRMHVVAFLDVSSQSSAFQALLSSCVLIGIVSVGLFVALSVMLANWMVKPVEKAWVQQREFVSDASHELKTPLTVIMSNAELLRSDEFDETSKEKFSENILTMSNQMRGLVETLLELARTDNGQVRKSFGTVDLSQIVADAVLPFEPVFFEKGLLLQSDIQPGICMTGSASHLRQVLEILLDNAQKYSDKGIVHVTLKRQGRRCLLTVSNPGEPIPKEELSEIFRRFYRADRARSRTGSFGLGLSIAYAIVQEHRGKTWAVSNQTGNCFCVELPCE